MSGSGSSGWGGNLTSGGGGGGGGGPSFPTIMNVEPVQGTQINPATPISFDCGSQVDLELITVSVIYLQTGACEVVWTGDKFAPNYVENSTRVPTTFDDGLGHTLDGFHYILRRRGGWPLTPTIAAHIADANGNTASMSQGAP